MEEGGRASKVYRREKYGSNQDDTQFPHKGDLVFHESCARDRGKILGEFKGQDQVS